MLQAPSTPEKKSRRMNVKIILKCNLHLCELDTFCYDILAYGLVKCATGKNTTIDARFFCLCCSKERFARNSLKKKKKKKIHITYIYFFIYTDEFWDLYG
jgi:hypothetical protein